jgi:hypothetical protein
MVKHDMTIDPLALRENCREDSSAPVAKHPATPTLLGPPRPQKPNGPSFLGDMGLVGSWACVLCK